VLVGEAQRTARGSTETASRKPVRKLAVVARHALFAGHRGGDLHWVARNYFDGLSIPGDWPASPSQERHDGVFFGNFNFYAFTLGLLFQLLLTARFLRRFGIGTALFVLPVIVFMGSAGLLVFGTLASAVALKGSDQTLRYSLDKSTAELLYLPIPGGVKLQVKWFIDTVVWRLGDGLSGLIILIFATSLHMPARQMSWIAWC